MTSLQLTALIFAAILVQVAAWAAIALYRRRRKLGQRPASAPLIPTPSGTPAWEGFREFRVHRVVVENREGDIRSFHLEPVDGRPLPPFRPGQYLTFRLEVPTPDGALKTVTRCYSLSDRPRPDHYRVTIKRAPAPPDAPEAPPGLSSNHFHDHVREGTLLQVKAPAGHFFLDEASDLPMVLVGGGIGITPMLSIIEYAVEQVPQREVILFYGVRNGAEVAMGDRLKALAAAHPNLQFHLCYSRPGDDELAGRDHHHRGRVDIERLRATLPLRRHQFYVCGPKAMMEGLIPALAAWGVPDGEIHYESFGPASLAPHAPRPAAAAEATVTFARSDRSLKWEGGHDSLLEFAEAHGIAVESGCRAGSCGCCMTRIESGEVEYNQAPDAEVSPGHCLLCISTPKTDLRLDA